MTSEPLGPTQPVISHHVKILVNARSAACGRTAHLSAGEHQRLVAAAAGHALHFRTWRSLVGVQGLTTPEAVTLMARLVEYASAGDGPAGLMASRR